MDLQFFRRHRTPLLAGGAAVLVLLAFVVLGSEASSSEQRALFAQPQRGPFEVTVTSTGELRAQNSTQIRGPSGAQRARIYQIQIQKLVPEGTVVKQGDFVAELDRSQLESNLKDASDNLTTAQSQHEQAKLDTSMTLSDARDNLVNLRYSMEEAQLEKERSQYEAPAVRRQAEISFEKSERAFRQAEKSYDTKVKQARAQVMNEQTALSRSQREMSNLRELAGQFTIRAPQDGMVIYRRGRDGPLEEGDQINAWNPVVATLPDLSSMESVTYVNEVDIQKIREGQQVEVGLDAAPDKRLGGTVAQVANVGEQRPGSSAKFFEVVVNVTEQDTTLRPGMTTSNTIIVDRRENALHIPLEAVHAQGDSLSYVFLRSGSSSERQEIALGLIGEDEAIVERGLDADDDLYLSVPDDTSGLAWNYLEGDAASGSASPQAASSAPPANAAADASGPPAGQSASAAGTWTAQDSSNAQP